MCCFFCLFLVLPWIFGIEQPSISRLCSGKLRSGSGRRSGEIPSGLPHCATHSSEIPQLWFELSCCLPPRTDLGLVWGSLWHWIAFAALCVQVWHILSNTCVFVLMIRLSLSLTALTVPSTLPCLVFLRNFPARAASPRPALLRFQHQETHDYRLISADGSDFLQTSARARRPMQSRNCYCRVPQIPTVHFFEVFPTLDLCSPARFSPRWKLSANVDALDDIITSARSPHSPCRAFG